MQEKIVQAYKDGMTPYDIHMKMNIGIKQVYHVLKQRRETSEKTKREKRNARNQGI